MSGTHGGNATAQSSRKPSNGDPANPLYIRDLRLLLPPPPWREKNPTAQSSRKPSNGDPANPLYIRGLRLYLPPPWREKNDLFDLFASCVQSNLRLKAESTNERTTELFIEDNWVSTGEGQDAGKARDDAATWALDTLSAFQPSGYKTKTEMLFSGIDRIFGLSLYLDSCAPSKEKAMDILLNSCGKCNLPVTWWDDGGGKVFGDGWSAVLLIKNTPICWGVGVDLNAAKKEAAEKAIEKLIGHPVVVIGNETNDDGKSNTPCASTSREGDKRDGDNTKATNPTSVAAAKEKQVDGETLPKHQHLIAPGTVKSSTDTDAAEKLPNFTLYLPEKYDSQGEKTDHRLILLESCSKGRVQIGFEAERPYKNCERSGTLKLRDRITKKSLTTTGRGRKLKNAKNNAALKAVSILRQCQPCVYNKVPFLMPIDRVHGLTLHLSPGKRKTYLSQLEKSCAKCNLPISWWDDNGSFLFGRPWAVVLLINSWPIIWGIGTTSAEAKESVAGKAIDLLKTKHPVVYENEKNKTTTESEELSTVQNDKVIFDVLSEWRIQDGNKLEISRLSNKLIENHLHKLFVESV